MPPPGNQRPESESLGRQFGDDPRRSRVAPVKGDNGPDEIAVLLKGVGSKAAAAALADSAALQKLPAAQQLALKRALIAATQEHEKAAQVQSELVQTKDRLAREEKGWGEEARAFSRKSEQAEAQVAGLEAGLAAAIASNQALKSRFQTRGWYLVVALITGLCAAALCAFLLPRQRLPGGTETVTAKPPVPLAAILPALPKGPPPPPQSPEVLALDRLSKALGGVPLSSADAILIEANAWLEAKGAPPCTVHFEGGKPALVVARDDENNAPLVLALTRCAEAVEHVVP